MPAVGHGVVASLLDAGGNMHYIPPHPTFFQSPSENGRSVSTHARHSQAQATES